MVPVGKRLLAGVAVSALIVAFGAIFGAGGPSIRFEKRTHDFGKLKGDEKTRFDWIFHNDGDAPLKILGTRPSCGCTMTLLEEDEIPPGGSGVIAVTFDAAGQDGSVRKTLSVISNDPDASVLRLTLLADVEGLPEETIFDGHPPISGQSLLLGSCAECHASPAGDKKGEALWGAVCGMCHGAEGTGGRAPGLRDRGYLGSRSDEEIYNGIAYGTLNPRMPGFLNDLGGPLDATQVRSLVTLIRKWGPVEPPADRP